MISPTDLFHPPPTPHFKTFQVFLIYCPKCPSFKFPYNKPKYSFRFNRTVLTLDVTVQGEVRPFKVIVEQPMYSSYKTPGWGSVVSCACLLVVLFSVVFSQVRGCVNLILVFNFTPRLQTQSPRLALVHNCSFCGQP